MYKQVIAGLMLTLAFQLTLAQSISAEQCENSETGSCNKWTLDSDTEVSYEELKLSLATGGAQLFDVREPEELEDGFIPGGTNIPLGEVEQAFRLTPDQFSETYGVSKPLTADSEIVFYCRRGLRSLTALETARTLGYTRARHYTGGLNEWRARERR